MSLPARGAGLKRLLLELAAIQRAGASGTLALRGAGSLAFRRGVLAGAAPAAKAGPADPRSQAREILKAGAASGEPPVFTAEEGAPESPAPAVAVNAGDLILDLVNAAADPDWVRSEILRAAGSVGPNPDPPLVLPRLALTPSQGFLLSRADGSMGLMDLLAVSPLDDRETLLAVYGLVAAGMLAVAGSEAPADEPAPPAWRSAAGPAEPVAAAAPPPSAAEKPKISDLDAFLDRTSRSAAAPAAAPPPPAASAPAPPLEAEREKVKARIAACDGADHYGVLRVDRTADEATVRRAYYRIAKKFHPDRFRKPGYEDLVADIERMFAATTEAYNTLTEAKARGEYDRHLAEMAGGTRPPDVDVVAQARESYLRGRKHLEAAEMFDALKLLETACKLDGSKAEYWLHLGVVQMKNPRWRKKAEESFLKALDLSPGDPQTYLHLARLYKSGGLARRAHEMFEKVLQWDAGNEEALQELGRAKPEAAGKTGRFKSLFKGSKS